MNKAELLQAIKLLQQQQIKQEMIAYFSGIRKERLYGILR